MTVSKAVLLLLKNEKVRKVIIGIICGILMIIFLFSISGDLMSYQASTSLSSTAEEEYKFWENKSPKDIGYSCQGQKYCSHFNSPVVDWCAYFAGYCIDRAGLNLADCGFSASCSQWGRNLKSKGLLQYADRYNPKVGNLVFFNYSGRSSFMTTGILNHVAIITEVHENNLTIIEGNYYSGATSNWATSSYLHKYTDLSIDDSSIACYGDIGADDIVDFNIDFVTSKTLCQKTRNVITHNEAGALYDDIAPAQFGVVLPNDNGALSIGVYGWHGNKARSLLQTAYSINSGQILSVCKSFGTAGSDIFNAIKGSGNWSKFIPNDTQSKCIKALLLTDAGIKAQDKESLQDANEYIKICSQNGLTKNDCIIYCCDILNQWGVNSFNANVYPNGGDGVLHNVTNKMTLESIYISKAGWGSKEQYRNRRTWTYNYLKK